MVRKAEERDLQEILSIYDKARAFMRAHGNRNQWRNGYPSQALLEYDIMQQRLYVLEDDFGLYVQGVMGRLTQAAALLLKRAIFSPWPCP